jgi:hypothetical protein
MVIGVSGETGLNVLRRVVTERENENGSVTVLPQIMEEKIAMGTRLIL